MKYKFKVYPKKTFETNKRWNTCLDIIEEFYLFEEAKRVLEGYCYHRADSFNDVLSELGISQDEIGEIEDGVIIE